MDSNRIQRTLKRMAYEIDEKNIDDKSFLLFGIDKRGYAIGRALGKVLESIANSNVEALQMRLKNGESDTLFEELDKQRVKDKYILVVDDVIFSGRTMFGALNKIAEHLDPPELYTAVMIDRGHRKYPIKSEFFGMELPTKLNEHVSVQIEGEKIERVILVDA